ncbi:hypothetical protein Bca101_061924 [Brassica carinata]
MGEDMLGLMSYCFYGDENQGGKLNFGGDAIVSGDRTISANMFRKKRIPICITLNLDAVSVGKTRIETLGIFLVVTMHFQGGADLVLGNYNTSEQTPSMKIAEEKRNS